jgi:hypothetical protein
MKLAWSSPAALAMAPLQDLLNLGAEEKMNEPAIDDSYSCGLTLNTEKSGKENEYGSTSGSNS